MWRRPAITGVRWVGDLMQYHILYNHGTPPPSWLAIESGSDQPSRALTQVCHSCQDTRENVAIDEWLYVFYFELPQSSYSLVKFSSWAWFASLTLIVFTLHFHYLWHKSFTQTTPNGQPHLVAIVHMRHVPPYRTWTFSSLCRTLFLSLAMFIRYLLETLTIWMLSHRYDLPWVSNPHDCEL